MKAMFKSFESGFSPVEATKYFNAGEIGRDEVGGFSKEYYNPMSRIDKRMQIAKASMTTQTGGAGTAGTAFVPIYPDPKVVDRSIRQTPLRAVVPRRAVRGLTYDYNALTAKGGAFWKGEMQSINDVEDTYDRVSVPIKFLYARGTISGPVLAATKGFIDPSALDLSVKTVSIYEAEEDALINGDSTTNTYEPNGLIKQITTNTTNLSGGYVTLPLIRAELATTFNAKGMVTLAVTDASTHNYIKGLLLSIQRNVENTSQQVLGFGIPDAFEFDGVLFIRDIFMPQSASSKRILFLDMRYIFFAVLQDLTYEEKYTDADGWSYMLKEYLTVVHTFESSSSQIYGIA